MGYGKGFAVTAAFLLLLIVYMSRASFPGPFYRSYVLAGGMLCALGLSWPLRLDDDEKLVLGLVFAVPMADQMIYARGLLGRMLEDLLLYVLIPLLALWLVRRDLKLGDVGLSLGNRRSTAAVTLGLLSVAVIMALVGLGFPSMTRYYPIWGTGGSVRPVGFALNEMVISVVMFAGEFFFRGVILFTLAKRSFWGAVIFQSLPYAFLHLGKPSVEVPYSLVAGIVFGWADLRSRSILPSWLTHSLGSALFDALVILT